LLLDIEQECCLKNNYRNAVQNLLKIPPPKKLFCQCNNEHKRNISSRSSDSGNNSEMDYDEPFCNSFLGIESNSSPVLAQCTAPDVCRTVLPVSSGQSSRAAQAKTAEPSQLQIQATEIPTKVTENSAQLQLIGNPAQLEVSPSPAQLTGNPTQLEVSTGQLETTKLEIQADSTKNTVEYTVENTVENHEKDEDQGEYPVAKENHEEDPEENNKKHGVV
jgi:hypothetical protein